MKAIVFSTQSFEKELLAKANMKKHDITLISNPLTIDTAYFAEGKDAVIVNSADDLSQSVIQKLALLGNKYITNRTLDTHHIDKKAAKDAGIKVARVLSTDAQEIANQTIKNLDNWQLNKCVGTNCACADACKTKN